MQVTPLIRGADGATLSGFTSGTAAAGTAQRKPSVTQQTGAEGVTHPSVTQQPGAGIATHASVADEAVASQALVSDAQARRNNSGSSGGDSSSAGSSTSNDGDVDGVSIEVGT